MPTLPTNVTVVQLKYNRATIQFTIPKISYTPETYYILYGTRSDQLRLRSDVRIGNTDVSTVGEVLSITLNYLKHNTLYHYKIVANNSENTVTSTTHRFQTHALGKPTGCAVVIAMFP